MNLANLFVVLSPVTGNFDRAMKYSTGLVQSFSNQAQSVGNKLRGVFTALTGIAIGGGLAYMLKQTMENIDATAKYADRLGITTQALIGLRHAAVIEGQGAASMDAALKIMTIRLGQLATGSSEADRSLKLLSLNGKELAKLSPDQAFLTVAEAISKIPSATSRASAAYGMFGRSGTEMVNVLSQGRQGIEALMEEADKLGLTFSRVDAAKVEEANDAISRLQAIFTGVWQTVAIQLAPSIEALTMSLVNVGTSGQGMGQKTISAIEWVVRAVAFFQDGLVGVGLALGAIGLSVVQVFYWAAQGVISGLKLIQKAWNALAESTVGDALGLGVTDFADTMQTGMDVMQDEVNKGWEQLRKDFEAPLPTEKVDEFFKDVREKAAAAEEQFKKTNEAKKALAKIADDQQAFLLADQNIEEVNKSLKEQIATAGMTKEQIELYKLSLAGLNVPVTYQEIYNERLKETKELLKQLEEREKEVAKAKEATQAIKSAEDNNAELQSQVEAAEMGLRGVHARIYELQQKGASFPAEKQAEYNRQLEITERLMLKQRGMEIFEEMKTPLEQYTDRIAELDDLLSNQAIDWETYERAVKKAYSEMQMATKLDTGTFQTIRTSLVDIKGLNMTQSTDPVVNRLDSQLEMARQQYDELKKLNDKEGLH